jgi:hypothetical protein
MIISGFMGDTSVTLDGGADKLLGRGRRARRFARVAGGEIVRPYDSPGNGGYSACFADLDGDLWQLARRD